MSTISVTLVDHATAKVEAEPSVVMELWDALSFEAPGAAFDPRVRKGEWDGYIRLFNRRSNTIPAGLVERVREFARERDYEFKTTTRSQGGFSTEDAEAFLDTLGIPERFDRRDYQVEAFRKAVESGRQLMVSPTSSGKSMIIYTLIRWYGLKTLVIVPTVGLVGQMTTDFEDYGCPLSIHAIQDGRDGITSDVTIATWQSIYEQPPEWFDQFGLVIGDEAHLFAAESLSGIMKKMTRCPNRFGFTGTLKGSKCHQLVLEGWFGPTTVVTTTRWLMDHGYVAQMKVNCVVLKHPKEGRRALADRIAKAKAGPKGRKMKHGALVYQEEIGYLYDCEARNRFIAKMVAKLKGNTLVLFHHVAHGDKLYDLLVQETNRQVHLINGGVSGLERNEIRGIVDSSDDAILLASTGTTSTGVNIRRIHNLVKASPWKSRIVVLQSVGRGLRMGENKDSVDVYDLADDLTDNGKRNHTLNHMGERVRIYASEDFDYRIHQVDLPY